VDLRGSKHGHVHSLYVYIYARARVCIVFSIKAKTFGPVFFTFSCSFSARVFPSVPAGGVQFTSGQQTARTRARDLSIRGGYFFTIRCNVSRHVRVYVCFFFLLV